MINLANLAINDLKQFVDSLAQPPFRAIQLIQWIHRRGVIDIHAMTNLSRLLRERLAQQVVCEIPLQLIQQHEAADGTCKWLFKLADGNAIETVFIPEPNRATLCISSQVGCALNCSFCSTAKQGFNRNLTVAEIIGQLWMARRLLGQRAQITNVVMMGMGEPLLNYENVLAALQLMMSDHAYNLSKYRVTVSTSGVVPAMQRLKQDSDAALAVSLHAPTNELRNQLVPLNKKYPLEQLLDTCRQYFTQKSKRHITFEYVMLDGINDHLSQAKQLVALLRGIPAKMNLIPFNPFPRTNYKTSSMQQISAFQQALITGGLPTWVRRTRGDDIDAACGQLAGQFRDRTGRHRRWQQNPVLIPEVENRYTASLYQDAG